MSRARGESRTLAARYRLDEVIGRGGMSTVYRATDLALGRTVAVKVAIEPLMEQDPILVARFKQEARAAAALSHPGAVTVYDAGADGPTRFIVMEYIPGRNLAEILRGESPLDPERAVQIAAQVADALSAAHAAGIVHRDVKPANVMIGPDGSVKVLDFGIARALDRGTLTQAASVLGTAPYMSPEQALGQPADARSDIYALGCVLYEMLTGRPPFIAEAGAAVMNMHVNEPPRPPAELNPDLPPALAALVMRMLAKSPDERPQSAAEVRDLLAEALRRPHRVGVALPPTEPAATLAASGSVEPAETVPRAASVPPADPAAATHVLPGAGGARRRPWALAAAVVVALLAGGAVALALSSGGNHAATGHSSGPTTPSRSLSQTTHSTSPATTKTTPPRTSTTSSTGTSTGTTATSSSTGTATTTPPTTTTPGGTGTGQGSAATPPGQGGTPPGQATTP